jgi:two-component system, sensor histidine kinase and response regulator
VRRLVDDNDSADSQFDARDLVEALEGDRVTAQAIATGFVSMRENLVERLAAALAEGDLAETQALTHEIRGMAGAMGARRLGAIAAALEAEARAGSPEAACLPLLEVLRREWRSVAATLERF